MERRWQRGGSCGGAPAGDAGGPNAGDVFAAIADHIARNGDLAGKIQNVFQFKLKNPDSVWTVDLKNAKGAVGEGETIKPDCTLELENCGLPRHDERQSRRTKALFRREAEDRGNVMASQKLQFLKSMDPAAAQAAVAKHRAGGGGASTKAAAPAAAKKVNAPGVFEKLGAKIGKNPNLVKEVGAVIAFKITEPDALYAVDLKNGKGAVKQGAATDAIATLILSDEDLGALA